MLRALLAAASIGWLLLVGCSDSDPVTVEPAPEVRAPVLWAVGDGGTATVAARDVADLLAEARPTRVIFLGDIYDEGTREEFDRNFDAVYGDLVHRIWPTPGNHEWPRHREGYDPYWREVLGKRLPHWYERRIGGWQVLSLNSEGDVSAGSRQLGWLRARLRADFGTCRIAFWHRPRFSAGDNGDQKDLEPLWDAVEGRAAIVLSGHDHDLQRLKPIGGTVQLVSGAGGRFRYSVDENDPRLAFADDDHYGALRIELHRERATLTFVAANGSTLDRSTVGCRR